MGALINKTTFEGGAFSKGGGAHWKGVINRIVTVITVLEAILTGKQSHGNIQCFVYFFPSCRLKFPRKNCGQMSGKSKVSDRTNLGTGAAPINC